ncbi:hypothetical protein [Rhizobium sp. WYCCWR 11146]|uniref:hypothetical protein n=1 Tax=Rhizobium sp. WYCCWR 11146 TaxID=2749833 RepID=UPI0015E6B70B|nr:hypothetical protein [Rhizobium sp. WYCCWR 11146]MBA1345798.1 hypothetical protein [Rhizobium sp. WYCCWR 11146]
MLENIWVVFPVAFASVAAVLVKREYRCQFPTQGHDMKAIISAACAAVLLLSGCVNNSAILRTDKHGKVSEVILEKSTGSVASDEDLKRVLISSFYARVSNPTPSWTYRQPMVLNKHPTVESYLHENKRQRD